MALRIAIHVQHLMGIGHLRRAAVLARALSAAGARVLLISGGMPVNDIDVGDAELVQLPATRAADLTYKQLLDESGAAVDDAWRARRVARLLEVVRQFQPHVVVTETYPFGRRLLRFELDPLVEYCAAASPRVKLVASIRDILEGFPGPEGRMDAVVQRVREHYDLVLIHGDDQFVRLQDTFAAASEIEPWLCYTGYVSGASSVLDAEVEGREVLVSTGGGVVGLELARTAINAAQLMHDSGIRWRVLIGHNLAADEFSSLLDGANNLADVGTIVERNRRDFVARLKVAAVSVSQAGYNTMAELLATQTPAVVVPFVADGQLEQTRRAQLLAERGRVHLLLPEQLTATALARAVERALHGRATTSSAFIARLDGATAAAHSLLTRFADSAQAEATARC